MERIQSRTRIQRLLSMIPLYSVSRVISWDLGGSLATLTDVKNWLTGKDPDAGKDWKEKRMTEDEMAGWYHRLVDMSLSKLWELVMDREAWCPWGHRELDMTAWLNWAELPSYKCQYMSYVIFHTALWCNRIVISTLEVKKQLIKDTRCPVQNHTSRQG